MARHTKRRRGKKRRKLTAAQKRARRRRYHHRVVKTRRKKIRARLAAWRATRRISPELFSHVTDDGALIRVRIGDHVRVDGKHTGTVEYATSDGWVGVRETDARGSSVHEWQAYRVKPII